MSCRVKSGVLLLFLLAPLSCFAASAATSTGPLSLIYRLILLHPNTHLISVEITVKNAPPSPVEFVMPAWSPGRYAIYNFAKNIQQFEAIGASGQALPWTNTDKETWRVDGREAGGAVTVRYRVFADDLNGSFSQFDPTHANINGASVYMYVVGHKQDPITLIVQPPPSWPPGVEVIDGYSDSTSQTTFNAPDYDRLIDTPVEVCPNCTLAHFTDHGKRFRVAVHSYGSGGESAAEWTSNLAAGIKKIVHSEMSMMPLPDFQEYTFMYHVSPFIEMGDGIEHLDSTEIIVPGVTGSATLSEALQIAAHEFFHTWNVKRLRPAGLGPFDYTREVYTRSLWFVEGITSYYAYLNLYRSGIWSEAEFLRQLAGEIRTFQQEAGRSMMSAESSSFHAWFYDRAPQLQQTNFINSTISYYNKGAILGMLLDLEIRERTQGRESLDDVLRYMYGEFYDAPAATYYLPGKGYTERDILDAVNRVSGSDFTSFFERYVEGTDPLPYASVLDPAGLELNISTAPGAPPALGAITEAVENGYEIMALRPGGSADQAGLARGDILIDVDGLSLIPRGPEEMLKMYPPGSKVPFTVQRYGQRQTFWVTLGRPVPKVYKIDVNPEAAPAALRIWERWLARSPNGNAGS
jgi:predicted metalloprotease with PDZ domain